MRNGSRPARSAAAACAAGATSGTSRPAACRIEVVGVRVRGGDDVDEVEPLGLPAARSCGRAVCPSPRTCASASPRDDGSSSRYWPCHATGTRSAEPPEVEAIGIGGGTSASSASPDWSGWITGTTRRSAARRPPTAAGQPPGRGRPRTPTPLGARGPRRSLRPGVRAARQVRHRGREQRRERPFAPLWPIRCVAAHDGHLLQAVAVHARPGGLQIRPRDPWMCSHAAETQARGGGPRPSSNANRRFASLLSE